MGKNKDDYFNMTPPSLSILSTWTLYLSAETEAHLASCPVSSRLFTKLVLEAPLITESALEVIRRYCEDEVRDTQTCTS